MKRKVIFWGVAVAGVVISIFFYGNFALTTEEADTEIESFLPPIFLYNSEGLRDPFVPLVAKERKKEEKVVVKEKQKARQKVEKPKEIEQKVEKPKPKKIVTHSGYRLIGLAWDKKGVFALIEGKEGKWIVKKGDRIGKFQVCKIDGKKGEVTLIGENGIVELRMRK